VEAVTGAFSYTGSFIARELVERGHVVRTLARGDPPVGHPLAGAIEVVPLALDHERALVRALEGVDVLYNTFWIRFPHERWSFEWAIAASARLFRAASTAGVRRIVHLSVTKPSLMSSFAYFRAKAAVEEQLLGGAVSAAAIRPSLIYGGRHEILLNNIAWCLRRSPVFPLPRRVCYVQPIDVRDVAKLAADAAEDSGNEVVDAVGPETFSYRQLVEQIKDAVGSRASLVALPVRAVAALGWAASIPLGDPLVTSEELGALTSSLLTSDQPPLGESRFSDWVIEQRDWLGLRYHSELDRHWRGR
jgi:uncharacterized protein YbjT (DUF2867 family)